MNRFVRKWLAEWEPERPVFGHATLLLSEMINHRPNDAWERILALVAYTKSEAALGCIGAGPLEDLLHAHGLDFIDRVEALAAADQQFAVCLSHVWGWIAFEPSVYERVQRVVLATTGKTV